MISFGSSIISPLPLCKDKVCDHLVQIRSLIGGATQSCSKRVPAGTPRFYLIISYLLRVLISAVCHIVILSSNILL